MPSQDSERKLFFRGRFAALCAALALAGGGALAAPTETVLYSFKGGSDGANPEAGLIADSAGNLYGTTVRGGVSTCLLQPGCGVVFKLAPDRTETVLHSFVGSPSDGGLPSAGLIADSGGNLYGTTFIGGALPPGSLDGAGVVFKLAPGGTLTQLHSFPAFTGDEANPVAALIADSAATFTGRQRTARRDASSRAHAAWCSSSRRAGP